MKTFRLGEAVINEGELICYLRGLRILQRDFPPAIEELISYCKKERDTFSQPVRRVLMQVSFMVTRNQILKEALAVACAALTKDTGDNIVIRNPVPPELQLLHKTAELYLQSNLSS